MHTIIVSGRLGRDPELRYTPDGTPVCSFSMADNSQGKGPVWFKVSAWKRLGEVCAEYLAKGRAVTVQGWLRPDDTGNPRTWTGQDGQARASYEVTAASVEFLGGRSDGETGAEIEPVEAGAEIEPVEAQQEIPF